VRHNAKQRINGEVRALFQPDQTGGQQQRDHNHRIERVDIQQQTKGNAQQRRVRQGIAEIGHSAPDHKRAERTRGAGKHNPGQPAGQ
jgi:hypothetical protein